MSLSKQSKQDSDVFMLDTYSEEAERSIRDCIIDKMLRKQELLKRGGSAMTNQQFADAFSKEPAIIVSDGNKIITYDEGLKLAQKGRYVQKIKVKFNMQTAAKVGVQRDYYPWGCCTMDAVIAHIPEIDIQRTQDQNGKWGFKARLLPDAERKAIRVLKVCQAVRELRDVPVNFKTELCKFHFGKHGCVNGGRCHFAHSKKELRNLAPPSPPQPSPRKPATKAPLAPWFRQDKFNVDAEFKEPLAVASPIQPPPHQRAPPAPPAPWFRRDKRDNSY